MRPLQIHRRDDEEGVGNRVGASFDGDGLLFHRLEETALGLRREQVDLSQSTKCAKIGPLLNMS